jgi:hypothetical protein
MSGDQFFLYEDAYYHLHKPSLIIKRMADDLYMRTYEDNLFNNFVLEEDLDNMLIEFGITTPFFKKDLENTEKKLNNAKIDLFKNWTDTNKRKKHKKDIHSIKGQLSTAYQTKHSLDFLTLEHYCDNIKNQYIILHSLFDRDSQTIVFKDTINIDYDFFNGIMQTIAYNVIDISQYKKLARSDYWRNYYNTNKQQVFGCPSIELSEEQRALLNTSIMYDRIYEHPDCPDSEIIEDDDALDGWMLQQQEENKKQKQQKGVDNILSDKVKNSREIFLLAKDQEQKEQIFSLNSAESANRLKEKTQAVLNSDKALMECELPDVQREIKQRMAELNKR